MEKNDNDIYEIVTTNQAFMPSNNGISLSQLIPSLIRPIINSLMEPYYRAKLIENMQVIKNNEMIERERKYRAILSTIEILAAKDKLTPELHKSLFTELHRYG